MLPGVDAAVGSRPGFLLRPKESAQRTLTRGQEGQIRQMPFLKFALQKYLVALRPRLVKAGLGRSGLSCSLKDP